MIQLTAQSRIVLAVAPIDFRKGIDGIACICRQQLKSNPMDQTWFVFTNRSKTMIRLLVYDGTGFWLMTKRLSRGRFRHWPTSNHCADPTTAKQLAKLLHF